MSESETAIAQRQLPQLAGFASARLNFLDRFRFAWNVAKLKAVPAPGGGFSSAGAYNTLIAILPGSNYDYLRDVGDVWRNSIVGACLAWQCRTMPEAPMQVLRADSKGREKEVRNHPLTLLMRNPNSFFDATQTLDAMMLSGMLDGNAYFEIVRGKAPAGSRGKPLMLNWLPHWMVEPVWESGQWLSAYQYSVGSQRIYLKPEDVLHVKFGPPDSNNPRKAVGPLDAVYREIALDNEASTMAAALARNMGIPGVVIQPTAEGTTWKEERAKKAKGEWMSRFGGDKRGEPYVLTERADVKSFAFSPQDMSFEALRRLPEERITAALGIPAIVVGFGAGLDRATYSNFEQAREAAYESNLIPTQRRIADAINTKLLPDLGDPQNERFTFDLTKVQALQADQNEIADRAATLYKAGVITRAEAKEMVGADYSSADDVYITDLVPSAASTGPAPVTTMPGDQSNKMLDGLEDLDQEERELVRASRAMDAFGRKAVLADYLGMDAGAIGAELAKLSSNGNGNRGDD